MHDIRAIRENPAAFDLALSRRGLPPMSSDLLVMDANHRAAIQTAETMQAEQNRQSQGRSLLEISDEELQQKRERLASMKVSVKNNIVAAKSLGEELRQLLLTIPNLPLDEVPQGKDEADNVEIRRWGNPRNFDFPPKEHFEIKGVQPGMDFETAAKLSGARFGCNKKL